MRFCRKIESCYSLLNCTSIFCSFVLVDTPCSQGKTDSQTGIKQTHGVIRKEFLLSKVSFISCPINVKSLSCIKAERRSENVSYIQMFLSSVFLLFGNSTVIKLFCSTLLVCYNSLSSMSSWVLFRVGLFQNTPIKNVLKHFIENFDIWIR